MRRNAMMVAGAGILLVVLGVVYLALSASGNGAQDRTATVSGIVTDSNRVGVPGAVNTIYRADAGGAAGNVAKLDVPDNPQQANNGSTAAPGVYTFDHVPYGTYNITAEIGGHVQNCIVEVKNDSGKYDITLPNYSGSGPEWGAISGMVIDENNIGIPGANVTLWNGTYDKAKGKFTNMERFNRTDNPQVSDNGSNGAVGMYVFRVVPWGTYNLTAQKDGHIAYEVITLGPGGYMGTAPCNLKLNGTVAI